MYNKLQDSADQEMQNVKGVSFYEVENEPISKAALIAWVKYLQNAHTCRDPCYLTRGGGGRGVEFAWGHMVTIFKRRM